MMKPAIAVVGCGRMGLIRAQFSGVFVGSATWWLALSGSISLERVRIISERTMKIINYASGITIIGF
ncbi:MAG: hypothetical protein CBHOC_4112 [uncultured Caballeronia sp.]|nr:MAG: hypothetical protein CBHOC_4112 [uncultured Caballeronia sp.]